MFTTHSFHLSIPTLDRLVKSKRTLCQFICQSLTTVKLRNWKLQYILKNKAIMKLIRIQSIADQK